MKAPLAEDTVLRNPARLATGFPTALRRADHNFFLPYRRHAVSARPWTGCGAFAHDGAGHRVDCRVAGINVGIGTPVRVRFC